MTLIYETLLVMDFRCLSHARANISHHDGDVSRIHTALFLLLHMLLIVF